MNHLENYKNYLTKSSLSRDDLIEKFISTRNDSLNICSNLQNEDFVVQPCPEVSPPKWHLAHTTWFFEELILVQNFRDYSRFNENYRPLFNSYYKSAGNHWIQSHRGQLSRPTVEEVMAYRAYVDKNIINFLRSSDSSSEVNFFLEVGLHHERQHQELLLMDIKYILATNPSFPAYISDPYKKSDITPNSWKKFEENIYEVGHKGQSFAYDNEGPRHKTYIYPFEIRESTISNGEYLQFMQDGGYSNAKYWLSEGWEWVNNQNVKCPLYWQEKDGQWFEYTLYGFNKIDMNAPVTHINYYEADAFANWTDHRLPTEFELEIFLNESENHIDNNNSFHPNETNNHIRQVWC